MNFEKARNILVPVRNNLLRIKKTGTAPINITQYKKMGLINIRTYRNKRGFITKSRLTLTPKAHRILTYV